MKTCKKCGAPLEDNAIFCGKCGEKVSFETSIENVPKKHGYFWNITHYGILEKPVKIKILKQTLIGGAILILLIILIPVIVAIAPKSSDKENLETNISSSVSVPDSTQKYNDGNILIKNDGRISTFSITLKEFCNEYNSIYESSSEKQIALKNTIGGIFATEIDEIELNDHIGRKILYDRISEDIFFSFEVDERFKKGEDLSDSPLAQIGVFFNNSVDSEDIKVILKEFTGILLNYEQEQLNTIINSLLTDQLGTSSYTGSYKDDCFYIKGSNNGIYNYFWLYADLPEDKIEEYKLSSKREASDSEVKKALDVISKTDFKSDFGTYNLYTALSTYLRNGTVTGTVDWFGYTTLTFRGKDKGGMDAYVKYYVDTQYDCCMFLGSDLEWEAILQAYPN